MPRTQVVVANKKKKTQASHAKVNKIKGGKCKSDDQNNFKTNAVDEIENETNAVKTKPIKGQGQTNVSYNSSAAHDYVDKKLKRSNSFFLTRKLSNIYDSLRNSKESLKNNNTNSNLETKTPFKFIRSVSVAAISLKKEYRNSMRKPKLEQLSEEDSCGAPFKEPQRKYEKKSKTASVDSLSSRTSEKSSVLSSFKRTFSLTPSRRKSTNPKWSASLMSLQQIDVMISYDDLRFIDYDKFNTYEENLMNKIKYLKQIDDNRAIVEQLSSLKLRTRSNNDITRRRHSTLYQQSIPTYENVTNCFDTNTKHWSNPCIALECITNPSIASILKLEPSSFGDVEIDCCASNINLIGGNADATCAVHSVDDLTRKSYDLLPLHMVSSSIWIFISLIFLLFILLSRQWILIFGATFNFPCLNQFIVSFQRFFLKACISLIALRVSCVSLAYKPFNMT